MLFWEQFETVCQNFKCAYLLTCNPSFRDFPTAVHSADVKISCVRMFTASFHSEKLEGKAKYILIEGIPKYRVLPIRLN